MREKRKTDRGRIRDLEQRVRRTVGGTSTVITNVTNTNAVPQLDDCLAPDDNTDLNASTSAHGLLPKLDNSASHFLDGQGSWSSPTPGLTDQQYLDDVILGKRFFSDAGLLPGTKYYESGPVSAPTPDWDNTGITPAAIGCTKFWESIGSTQLLGWDTGANRQRILFICAGWHGSSDRLQGMATTKPSSGDATGNGYAGGNNSAVGGLATYRFTAGAYTNIGVTNTMWTNHAVFPPAQAMLFDNGNVYWFFKGMSGTWMRCGYKADGTHTSLRHCWFRIVAAGHILLGPVSIYYDT